MAIMCFRCFLAAIVLTLGANSIGCSKFVEPPVVNEDDENNQNIVVAEAEEPANIPTSEKEPLTELPPPDAAQAMPAPNRVWIDKKNHLVYVDGYVSLREGMLEMFACPKGTKEHESIVAVESMAQVVHAALLAVGAKTGQPVQWVPEFKPPTGTEIAIEVRWLDSSGKWQKSPAQEWIINSKTRKPMQHPWVFAGSGFWKNEQTGEELYMAESGDFICVSNFDTATLDIPAESSQVNDGLMYEANTKKIPPLGTLVRLVLKPKLDKE
jgi:hypothetical protein